MRMTSELEIVTPNLRGSCVTEGRQIHGLFRVMRRTTAAQETYSAPTAALADAVADYGQRLER